MRALCNPLHWSGTYIACCGLYDIHYMDGPDRNLSDLRGFSGEEKRSRFTPNTAGLLCVILDHLDHVDDCDLQTVEICHVPMFTNNRYYTYTHKIVLIYEYHIPTRYDWKLIAVVTCPVLINRTTASAANS